MKSKILTIAIFLFTITLKAQTKSWGASKIKIGTIPAVTAVDSILVPSATGLVQHITYSNFFAKMHQDLLDAGLGGGGSALTFTLPLSETGDVVSMTQAGLAQNGWISSADFTTFNNKVSFPGFTNLLTDYSFTDNSTNWDLAFGYGDHADAGYETTTARTNLPAGNYTTDTAQTGMSVDMTIGTVITLDDANVNVGDYFNFYNNTGGDITWQFGASDIAIEGVLANLPDKKHGFARLVALNLWTVIDGSSDGGGEPLWIAEESNVPRLNTGNIYTIGLNEFVSVRTDNLYLGDNSNSDVGYFQIESGTGNLLQLLWDGTNDTFRLGAYDLSLERTIAEIDANYTKSLITKEWSLSKFAQLSTANLFTDNMTIDTGLGIVLETTAESPQTAGVYFLGAPNNMSGHVLNTDGSLVDNGEPVANMATTENLYGLDVNTEETSSFSKASVYGQDNIWIPCTHATVDITVTLDQGVKDRVIYFEQVDAAQVLFVAGAGVTLTHSAIATTPKTRDKGSVVGAVWKSATLIHLVGALEDN